MAAEPTSVGSIGLTALLVALLGPASGEYAAIVFAALAGAMWPLSTMQGTTKRSGAFFLIKIVITAVVLTGGATYWLEQNYNFPARYGMTVVAFIIGALGNGWGPVIDGVRDAVVAIVIRFGKGPDTNRSEGQ